MSQPRDTAGFLREFVTRPREVGALAPSSPALGKAVAECVPWSAKTAVVEAGPGDGAITEFLVENKPDDATFFAVELNPQLASTLAERLPEVPVVVGDLCDLPQMCADRGLDEVDAVVATLPWSVLSETKQRALLDGITGVLAPGGRLVFYVYLHALPFLRRSLFVKLIRERFETMEEQLTVWRNIPPAVVFSCRVPDPKS